MSKELIRLTKAETLAFNKQLATLKTKAGHSGEGFYEIEAKKIYESIVAARENPPNLFSNIKDNENDLPEVCYKYPHKLKVPEVVPVIPNPNIAPLGNWIAKSGIFAPRPRNKRADTGSSWLKLESPRGVQIEYNGPMLDMADHTLYLNLLKQSEGRHPDDNIFINRANLLRSCGYKALGQSGYKWLSDAFGRLLQANIRITVDNYILEIDHEGVHPETIEINGRKRNRLTIAMSLLSEYAVMNGEEAYYFSLPKTSMALFSSQLWGYNNLQKRLALLEKSKSQLSAWLQSYICADSKGKHSPIFVETLKDYSAYKSKLTDFVRILTSAFDNCLNVGIINKWSYVHNEHGKLMVEWER